MRRPVRVPGQGDDRPLWFDSTGQHDHDPAGFPSASLAGLEVQGDGPFSLRLDAPGGPDWQVLVIPLLADRADHVLVRDDSARFLPGNPWGFAMHAPEALYNRGELHNLRVERGTLTAEERFKINEHIVETIIMLSRLQFPPDLTEVPEMAGGHHETMDGRGYPRGLRREDMSVTARILAISDVFEALTATDRPYKTANSTAEALAIMKQMAARQAVDPDLLELFIRAEVWRETGEHSDTLPGKRA